MSERKVLNKYYPPDFDPSKIPRLHLPKDRQYTVRLMAPCNMRCKTCGEYIYKGKKFNARKETVQGEDYLGIKIFRFYIKCTRCLAEITFKTDPQNADYIVEHGATRNFQALKLAEEQAEREQREVEEEEASNPMKLLENRTKASKYEMETLENLEELRDLNQRHANVDYDYLLQQNAEIELKQKQQEEEEDEKFIQSIFGKKQEGIIIKRLHDDSDDDEDEEVDTKKFKKAAELFHGKPSDVLVENTKQTSDSGKTALKNLVRAKSDMRKNKESLRNSHQPTEEKPQYFPTGGLSLIGMYSESNSSDSD